MSSDKGFLINFDKKEGIFSNNDRISGTLEIINSEELKFKAIYLEVHGYVVVCWNGFPKVEDGVLETAVQPLFDLYKEFFFEKILLNGKEGGFLDRDSVLQPGHHRFNFDLALPTDLPSSFEGRYGKVIYEGKGIIEKSGFRSRNVVCQRQFTHLAVFDLNLVPEASVAIEICKFKEIGLCCAQGSITIDWIIDKSGFVAGDEIKIRGSVQNDSKKEVFASSVSLYMIVEYKWRKRRLIDRVKIACIDKGGVNKDDVTVWNDALVIPSCPSTSLERSKIISITYEVELKVIMGENLAPIMHTKGIYIGTIPLAPIQADQSNDSGNNEMAPPAAIIIPCYVAAPSAGTGYVQDYEVVQSEAAANFPGLTPVMENNRPPPYAPGHSDEVKMAIEDMRKEMKMKMEDAGNHVGFTSEPKIVKTTKTVESKLADGSERKEVVETTMTITSSVTTEMGKTVQNVNVETKKVMRHDEPDVSHNVSESSRVIEFSGESARDKMTEILRKDMMASNEVDVSDSKKRLSRLLEGSIVTQTINEAKHTDLCEKRDDEKVCAGSAVTQETKPIDVPALQSVPALESVPVLESVPASENLRLSLNLDPIEKHIEEIIVDVARQESAADGEVKRISRLVEMKQKVIDHDDDSDAAPIVVAEDDLTDSQDLDDLPDLPNGSDGPAEDDATLPEYPDPVECPAMEKQPPKIDHLSEYSAFPPPIPVDTTIEQNFIYEQNADGKLENGPTDEVFEEHTDYYEVVDYDNPITSDSTDI